MRLQQQQQHLPLVVLPLLIYLSNPSSVSNPTLVVNALNLPTRLSASLSYGKREKQKQKQSRNSVLSNSFSSDNNKNNEKHFRKEGSLPLVLDDVGATIPEEIFNLVKSIIGAGVLSLPAGIALMANTVGVAGTGSSNGVLLFSSCLLIALMGSISAYTFSLIARVCRMTNSTTYAECWTSTKGQSLAWIVALSSTLDCFAGNLTYSMVLADTFRQLLSSLFFKLGGINGSNGSRKILTTLASNNSRSNVLLLLTVTVLLPLCCVKNLSSLAPYSLVGILGMVYTGIVIGLRYFDGSYQLPNGKFLTGLKSLPSFTRSISEGGAGVSSPTLIPLMNPNALILVSMLSTAYIAHFNAPKFYKELKGSSTKPKRFHLGVVIPSFAVSILFYSIVSSLGYLTFGSSTAGMILSNYSTKDVLISLARFAVGLSLIFSYPLLFVGLRDGIVDLINEIMLMLTNKKNDSSKLEKPLILTEIQSNRLTVGLLSSITVMALKITDLTFVASMSGALLGTSLIFIIPTLMFRSALKNESEQTNKPYTNSQKFERQLCSVIAALGVFIAGVGTKMAWTAAAGST